MHSFAGAATSPALFVLPAVAVAGWLFGMRYPRGVSMGFKAASLRHCLPEICGLLGFAVFAATLLSRGKHNGFLAPNAQQQQWMADIKTEWPMLVSADSLFVLQGMMRVLVASSVALRATPDSACLAGEPAALFLLACICRLVLFGMSPVDVYHIDGPLGGVISILVDAAAVPPLLYLSRGLTRSAGGIVRVLCMTIVAVMMAYYNRFSLAADAWQLQPGMVSAGGTWYLDFEFSLVQTLDFVGACAFMAATLIASDSGKTPSVSMSFSHVCLLVQQMLPAYFFVYGLAPALTEPTEIVGAGYPFPMMWAIGLMQFAMYGCAALFHFAALSDEPHAKLTTTAPLVYDVYDV